MIMAKYGVALDLGTSGFRSHLVDLEQNAKIIGTAMTVRHPLPGANIMDHLHFWMKNGSDLGHKIIMDTIHNLVSLYGKDKMKDIEKIAICGNPIQLSMFENIEVRDLAFAGKSRLKTLGVTSPDRSAHVSTAGKIGIPGFNSETEVYIPPAIRHEIGADALAMIIKSKMLEKDQNCMVTDYGTNAEMGLYYDGELYSGSAAAGPAMEGQSIKYGMLAAPHVISDFNESDDGTWENIVLNDQMVPIVTSKVDPLSGREVKLLDYEARGITGTGVVSAMALGLKTNAIKLPKIDNSEGQLKFSNGIYFTDYDVQEAGKAMGAIRAGHRTLMKEVGVDDSEVRIMYMAGASGTYVDPIKAQYCGMIPRVLDEVYQLGNTSLMMAHDLLKDSETLDMMQSVANSISANHIMFAGNKIFEDMYVLELAYWTEGMDFETYNTFMEMQGLGSMPDIVVPKKVVRVVKSDIPETAGKVHSMEEVGIILEGKFDGCTGCKKCQKGCPEKALTVSENKVIRIRSDLCLGTACQACEMNCPEKVYQFASLKAQ